MKKVLTIFSFAVIFLFILSVFGWMVHHITVGDRKFGFFYTPVKFMYSFPDMFKKSVEEVQTLPGTFIKTTGDFTPVNELDSDLVVLTSYSDKNDSRSIEMVNLKNDSVLYKWNIENPYEAHDRIIHPILLPGKNLIFSFMDRNLFRIDSLSNIVWRQDSIFSHHAINFDSNGDLWVCSREPFYYASGMYKIGGRSVFYIDNHISKIDVVTGHILFDKSISEILLENNLSQYIIKAAEITDPIHVNDVQPALKTTEYYNEGDLFLSLRQMSLILQYRPSTNEVIRVLEGPFFAQHDVDFYGDDALVFFNNNSYVVWNSQGMDPPKDSAKLVVMDNYCSNIVKYNFGTETYEFVDDSVFKANGIYSHTEGIVEFLDPDTYFIEQQNYGVLWVIRNKKVIYKNIFKSQHDGYHHLTNWTRIIRYGS